MTATLHTPRTTRTPTTEVPVDTPNLGRVITSEWIKFRTLRSSWAVLGSAMLGMVAIGLIIAYNTRQLGPNLEKNDLTPSAPLQGYYLGQLLVGSLGVLFVTGEFSTGMISSTFAAVPKRVPVLWAKLIVFVSVTLVSMVAMSFVAFLSAEGLISRYRTGYSLSSPGALRVVVGTGVFLTLVGVIGAMIGWIVRSTPGALVTFFALLLVLPIVFGSLLGSWGANIAQYLPSNAGAAFATSLAEPPQLLAGAGFAVLVVWVLALGVAAVLTLRRRDA